ncbi:MAG TPA: hypothetical protein PKD90_17725 [Phnomibacter sp.]|nr:hypothetical protein [Phnomibacter sp.]
MEPEVRLFLVTIVQTVSMGLLWMLVHTWLGIRMGYLFLDGDITIWHGIYYLGLIGSFVAVFIYIKRKWKKVQLFGHGNPEE